MSENTQSWERLEALITFRLDKLDEGQEKIKVAVQENKDELTVIKAKAGIWGSVAGLIVAAVSTLLVKIFGNNIIH